MLHVPPGRFDRCIGGPRVVGVLAPNLSALLFLVEESTFPQQDLNNCAVGVLEGVRIATRGHLSFGIEAALQRD